MWLKSIIIVLLGFEVFQYIYEKRRRKQWYEDNAEF